jgi:Tol biopolymer transport system component/tRNA A-37 threonylcarbamoyl transferase component Bud32
MGTASRVCPSCDTPLPLEAKFCLNCGAATPAETGEHPSAAPPSEAQLARLKEALADRYKIESVVGQGGMATVYLAEDLRHQRKVAVKVLRPELAAALGSDRFLREIGIAARLQHPHILMLIDSGEADGFLYYVMPFVEGESLRQKLVRERELPISEAVRILHDVVDALANAHSHGVVHRDIKPDNVLLSGRHALVVDFGVAKAVSQATGRFAPTTEGLSLGTPTYMAPEQAAADPHIDHRADIYAVGAMAYELLTGTPPIKGETPQAVLAAQITESPKPIHEVRPTVPPSLAQLVMRCLEKRPADRWQTAEELLPQLEALTTPSLGMTPSTTKPITVGQRRWARWAVIGTLAVVAATVGLVATRDRGPRVDLPQPVRRQLTYDGNVGMSALSPDGQYLAYVVYTSPAKIMVQDLAGGTALVVADSIGHVSDLRWSPDGTRLCFAGEYSGRLGTYLFPRLGGAPQRVQPVPFLAWSPDGTRIAGWMAPREWGIRVQGLTSGETDSLLVPGTDRWTEGGDWSPQGDLLALITHSADGPSNLWVLNLGDGTHVLTLADSVLLSAPHWAPSGDAIYYVREGDLYRIAVDPRNGLAEGSARRIMTLEGLTHAFGLSGDGVRLMYTKASGHTNFSVARVIAGRSTEQVTLTTGTAQKNCPRLSPDGAFLAFLQETDEDMELYRVATSGGAPERLTFSGSVTTCPAWGPSGRRLALATQVGGTRKLAVVPASGGSLRIFENTQVSQAIAWAPGSLISYQVPGNRNFRLLDPETEEEQLLVQNDSVGWMFRPRFSPDGSKVAVLWNRWGMLGIWLISLDDSTQVLLAEDGSPVGWSEDGRSVYARDDYGVFRRFPVAGGEAVVVPEPELDDAYCEPYERPEGLVWVCREGESFSDVWMIENFDPEMAGRSR